MGRKEGELKYIICYLLLVVMLISCSSLKSKSSSEKSANVKNAGWTFVRVRNESELDGCSFLLYNKSGNDIYQPVNLADSLKKDGMIIGIKFSLIKNYIGVCMKGTPVTLTAVRF